MPDADETNLDWMVAQISRMRPALLACEAMTRPDRVILQVMDIGDYADVRRLESELGNMRLARTLRRAEAGQLTARTWNYWHHRLRLAKSGRVPPAPRRHFA